MKDSPLDEGILASLGADLHAWMQVLQRLARDYRRIFNRPLPLTQELGELYACTVLSLERAPHGMAGYDATDGRGARVQIKSRAPQVSGVSVPRPVGRVGRFHSWDFDYTVLVLLTDEYALWEMWRAEQGTVRQTQALLKNPRHGIAISKFTKLGSKLCPPSDQTD